MSKPSIPHILWHEWVVPWAAWWLYHTVPRAILVYVECMLERDRARWAARQCHRLEDGDNDAT